MGPETCVSCSIGLEPPAFLGPGSLPGSARQMAHSVSCGSGRSSVTPSQEVRVLPAAWLPQGCSHHSWELSFLYPPDSHVESWSRGRRVGREPVRGQALPNHQGVWPQGPGREGTSSTLTHQSSLSFSCRSSRKPHRELQVLWKTPHGHHVDKHPSFVLCGGTRTRSSGT